MTEKLTLADLLRDGVHLSLVGETQASAAHLRDAAVKAVEGIESRLEDFPEDEDTIPADEREDYERLTYDQKRHTDVIDAVDNLPPA